ncbi:amidohydrolase [Synechococcus sp. BA-124 BA4]|uniref:amidohydrolase n=1 Tax=unclassified Synechococcus TaxID=2626047 RepID=UPI0018CE4388|nr:MULTISPECIES: amidohydrolase [unclassified Synechococcus]MEA5401005.1 amidohydrolase [Synechococcus sp. BA-124 BA4]
MPSTPRPWVALLASVCIALPSGSLAGEQTPAGQRSVLELYRHLHANPELSLQETRTASLMAAEARAAGFEVTENVGGTGVVALLRNGPGPVVMIRTDMDALPVSEATGWTFASTVRSTNQDGQPVGVMHACGHDTHMAAWVATLRRLAQEKTTWSGTLMMVAQPAEELGRGAVMMLDDGLFRRFPKPDVVLAFHNSASLPAGVIGVSEGYALANVDSVDIRVRGKGGHGAYPHTTRDPIVLGARIVLALQTLVSREINPLEPAVVSVGSFTAGTKRNVIPDEALLQLTVRSYKPEIRQQLLEGMARIARGEAIAAGVAEDRMPEVTITKDSTPATYNTPELVQRFRELMVSRVGKDRLLAVDPVMAGEDFGRYRLSDPSIQSLIFWVGGVPAEPWQKHRSTGASLPSLHSPEWGPDYQAVIETATDSLTTLALDLFNRPAPASRS